MRPAPRSSVLSGPWLGPPLGLILLAAVAVQAAPRPKEAPTPTPQDIQAAEQAQAAQLAAQQEAAAKAAAAADEEQRLTAARVAAAAKLRQAETATAQAANRMADLADKQRAAEAGLTSRAEAIQPLLPLIERLALYPAETLLAVPLAPEDAVRGLIVLRGVSREVAQEAAALRRDQAVLAEATRAVQAEAPKLAAAEQAQAAEAADLDRQITATQAQRRAADAEASAAAERAAAEAARAENLRNVLKTLEAQRKAEEAKAQQEAVRAERQKRTVEASAARRRAAALARPDGSLAAANMRPRAQLTSPVAGSVVRAWGEATEAGPATGISYQAPPAARVVAPCGGRVVFADPFRSYGQLLILDCGGGYHAVLAGFERLDAKVGQSVGAGEPVGAMPSWDPGGTGRRPLLYIELRHDGQPVNPAPWLKSAS
jgi:septal ring factor EnvC (AmiA/AmiB activator)